MGKFLGKMKRHVAEVLRVKDSPHAIASGFALGTCLAVLPTFGLGAFIGLALLAIFRKVSKVSMLASFLFWNPFVLFPLYGLSYSIGDFLYMNGPGKNFEFEFASELYIYSTKFLIGNFLLVIFFTVFSYITIYLLAGRYQKNYRNFIDSIEETVKDPRNLLFHKH